MDQAVRVRGALALAQIGQLLPSVAELPGRVTQHRKDPTGLVPGLEQLQSVVHLGHVLDDGLLRDDEDSAMAAFLSPPASRDRTSR